MRFRASSHAVQACAERGIAWAVVEAVLSEPEQISSEGEGRRTYQSRIEMHGETFLLRVVVGYGTDPPTVVTVYRTRKIAKYWSAR
jgi:hypothetical protein